MPIALLCFVLFCLYYYLLMIFVVINPGMLHMQWGNREMNGT